MFRHPIQHAIGELSSVGNAKFSELADDLALYLKKELGSIFGKEFIRKFSNIWCTLGYFSWNDFCINDNDKFVNTFNEWNPLDRSISTVIISELQHDLPNL